MPGPVYGETAPHPELCGFPRTKSFITPYPRGLCG